MTSDEQTAKERAVLRACLEWQYEAGCVGWLKEEGTHTGGWRAADKEVRATLAALTLAAPTLAAPTLAALDAPVASTLPRSISAQPQKTFIATPEVARKEPALLAPVEAVVRAEKIASGCKTLAALEDAVHAFDLCGLKKAARSTVFAEGNPEASLMIVGEAPGRDEDEQGKPFIGASGQLLARMLEAINIKSREQYRVTNLVYWRPPGNRPPDSDELAICRPFFVQHVALMRPRWLLLLGNVAAQNVLDERRGISKIRGQLFPLTLGRVSLSALPSFHPSYLLRTPAKKAAAWHDLLVLHRAMQKGRMEDADTQESQGESR